MDLLTELWRAYYDARKHKRNKLSQLQFELNAEENIMKLYHAIRSREYKPQPSVVFVVNRPVKREVFAAQFADRVVHHLYFNMVAPLFERKFIDDCYSCRRGRGTGYGIKRLGHHIRSCSDNYTKPCWVLKLDIRGYFMSIDRTRLFDKVAAHLERQRPPDHDLALWLSQIIIFNDPIDKCVVRSPQCEWHGLPRNKSLFGASVDCGLPIGNLTSQLFSNIYLSEFDWFVKRTLGAERYGRYVDDFYVVHSSREWLAALVTPMNRYLDAELGLIVHPHKIFFFCATGGVPFLGVIIRPWIVS